MAGPSRPRWGWHQLDRSWAHRLVVEADLRPGELVLDIGAGRGALVHPLLEAGTKVVAVERHPLRARYLRDRFVDEQVIVVQADAADLRLPRRPFRVVANPPFGIVHAVVRRLVAPGSRLVAAHLIVPAYVARRWTGPSAPGRERWSRVFSMTAGGSVPRDAFRPPPPHDAAILLVRRHSTTGARSSAHVARHRAR